MIDKLIELAASLADDVKNCEKLGKCLTLTFGTYKFVPSTRSM